MAVPTIRRATAADLPALEPLWLAFEQELPEPPYVDVDLAEELRELADAVARDVAVVAEDENGALVGLALARRAGRRLGILTDLYVVPAARRTGLGSLLAREAFAGLRDLGVDTVRLEVLASNALARSVYARWGFREEELTLAAPLQALLDRLDTGEGASTGAVFVQTDDRAAVERAATAFAPRIGSRETEVDAPRDGWIAVRDSVASRDPAALRRLAKELSDRLGAVVLSLGVEAGAVVRLVAMERGSVLDEYLSVPEFHGPLPPGDVVALAANPTVLARLTGADPAAIRAAAPTATSVADLPPAPELAERLAAALGLPALER
jgi:ribosomal protein S18 acetylase RimI-like enzyme